MSFTCASLSLSLSLSLSRSFARAQSGSTTPSLWTNHLGMDSALAARRQGVARRATSYIKFVPQHGNAIHLVARNSRQVNAETIRACVEEGERVIFRTRQFQIFFEHQGKSLGVMVFEGMTLEDAIAQLPESVRKSMDEFRFQHQGKPCSRDALLASVGVGKDSNIVTAGRLVGGMPPLRGQGAGSSNGRRDVAAPGGTGVPCSSNSGHASPSASSFGYAPMKLPRRSLRLYRWLPSIRRECSSRLQKTVPAAVTKHRQL